MLVIDFYTKRLLGPKEIAQRAAYQPQIVLPEPWISAEFDEDIGDLTEPDTDHEQPVAWNPDRPRTTMHREGETDSNRMPDADERQKIDDYARWIARGRYKQQKPANASEEVKAKPASKEPTKTSLQDPAEELRRAAKRLRDLAEELRVARLGLAVPEKRRDQP